MSNAKYNVICDSSGQKLKRNQVAYQWNGMLVKKSYIDPYPLRLIHPNVEETLTLPDCRPEGPDIFLTPTEKDI